MVSHAFAYSPEFVLKIPLRIIYMCPTFLNKFTGDKKIVLLEKMATQGLKITSYVLMQQRLIINQY